MIKTCKLKCSYTIFCIFRANNDFNYIWRHHASFDFFNELVFLTLNHYESIVNTFSDGFRKISPRCGISSLQIDIKASLPQNSSKNLCCNSCTFAIALPIWQCNKQTSTNQFYIFIKKYLHCTALLSAWTLDIIIFLSQIFNF